MSAKRHSGDVELHIDRLVLHGIAQGDRHRVAEAIRQELIRQIGERGIPETLLWQERISLLNAGAVQAERVGRPEQIGARVAQAVYRSIAGKQSPNHQARSLGQTHTGSHSRVSQFRR